MSEQKNIVRNQKSVQEVSKHGKTDIRYWQSKLFKPWYTRDGKRFELDQYSIKLQHFGQRVSFVLGTPNRAAAAAKAKEIFIFVHANGWAAALARYKPGSQIVLRTDATVGDFLEELKAKADLKEKTLEGYARAFRKILADAFAIDGGNEKFDYQNGGRKQWLDKIHAVKLADVTPARMQEWKRTFLARAGNNQLEQRTARVSVNSFLRCAKSLFAPAVVKHLETVRLPSPLPFDGISFEKRPSMRYRSIFDVSKLVEKAREELAGKKPEQFKIFLLAVMGGLRRNEIDKLEWTAFRWDAGAIRIEATSYFHPKSEDSIGDVEIDPELLEVFRGYRARATGRFVVESPNPASPESTSSHYRCQKHFEKLLIWLRKNGVKTKTPLHTLRKEFGSQICDRDGIFQASRALRHASIGITAAHYVDRKKRSVSGLGHLLSPNVTAFDAVSGDKHAVA